MERERKSEKEGRVERKKKRRKKEEEEEKE